MAVRLSEVGVTVDDGIHIPSTNTAEDPPKSVDTTNLPFDGDPSLDEPRSHIVPVLPHDPTISSPGSASRCTNRREFVLRELSPLLEATLSKKDEDETIRRLPLEDARILVDAIDETLDTPDLPPFAQKRYLRLLYRTCGHHAIIPSALKVVVDCKRTGVALYRGGYADVWKGRCSGLDVAVKVIRVYSNDVLQKVIHKFCKEAVMWKSLRHPNTLPLIGVEMTEDEFVMVSEWMMNGNINEFIKANPEAERIELLVGVTEGLIYLHENGMVHGDLKGLNILIDQTCNARLADFGLLTIMSDPANLISSSSHGKGGTVRWMSPELIIPEKFGYKTSRLTKSSDCYALGMVIYETVGGNIPFHEHTDVAASIQVILGQHPTRGEMFPDHLWGMMELCWTPQPDGRPRITDVLQCLKKTSSSSESPSNGPSAIQMGTSDTTLTPDLGYATIDHGPAAVSHPPRPVTTEAAGKPEVDTTKRTYSNLSISLADLDEGGTYKGSPHSLAEAAPPRIEKHHLSSLPSQPPSRGTLRSQLVEGNDALPTQPTPQPASNVGLERERAIEASETKTEFADRRWRNQQQGIEESERQWTREREKEARGGGSGHRTEVPSDTLQSHHRKDQPTIHNSPHPPPSRRGQGYSEYSSRNAPSEGRSSRRSVGTPVPNKWAVSWLENAKPKVLPTSPSLTYLGNRDMGDLRAAAAKHPTPLQPGKRGPPPSLPITRPATFNTSQEHVEPNDLQPVPRSFDALDDFIPRPARPYAATPSLPLPPYPLPSPDVPSITTKTTATASTSQTQPPLLKTIPHSPAPSFSVPGPLKSIPSDDDSDDSDDESGTLWDISDNTQLGRSKRLVVYPLVDRRPTKPQKKPPKSFRTSVFNEDFRPPAEEMCERLGDFFPGHDLDEPTIEASSGGAPPTSAEIAQPFPTPSGRKHKKSIRVVANEHIRKLDRTSRVSSANDVNMLRKRSTKLWGSRVEEVTTDQIKSLSSVLSAPPESPAEPKPIFKWLRGDLISKGAYDAIYVALNATTGEMIAVKQVEIPRTEDDTNCGGRVAAVEALKLESEILKDLDHPNVVQYLGFEETPRYLTIFLEYFNGGSIASVLKKQGRFKENVTKSFTSQILDGLDYLHSKGVIHRGLKADSIFVDKLGHCAIADFGASERADVVDMNEAYAPTQRPVFWMAPEVVSQNEGCNSKIDIWSFGCVVHEMWTGERPWCGQEVVPVMLQLHRFKLSPPLPDHVVLSHQASDFRKHCFAMDPDERPTAGELRKHPYLLLPLGWEFTGYS